MSDEKDTNLPSQQELEKDISEYLSKKYGERVKIVGLHAQPLENKKEPPGQPPAQQKFLLNFTLKPEELVAYLDEYVIRQDEAKAILATKICTHFNRIRHALSRGDKASTTAGHIKNNVLLIGPTGVGKTFLVKLIAKQLGVPFVKGDATKFSETGYVGGDVDDLVRDLVREAGNDLESAQYGIIYVDEIDKIASSPHRFGPDVSRAGVQRALLKPMEETEIDLKVPHDPLSQIEAIEQYRATGKRQRRVINTKNILFIMSGAFTGLEEIIKKRVRKQAIGFEGTISSKQEDVQFFKQVASEDLIEYGFESEFIGRLPVHANLEPLTVADLHEILRNPNNTVVVGKKLDFKAYGINIQFDDQALQEIAARAQAEHTGARGLISVMEKTLLPFEKKLPSTGITFLSVSLELVLDPRAELERMLGSEARQKEHELTYYRLVREELTRLRDFILTSRGQYLEANQIDPRPVRLDLMARVCQQEIMDVGQVCELFCGYIKEIRACGQKISQKSGIEVTFSEEAIDLILARPDISDQTILEICSQLRQSMEYGLDLLAQKNKKEPITIPASAITGADEFINNLVAQRFRQTET